MGNAGCLVWLAASLLGAPPPSTGPVITTETLREWHYYNNMAYMALNRGELDVAEVRFKTAVKTIRDHARKYPRDASSSYFGLAHVYYRQKRFDDAAPLARWAMDTRENNPKAEPSDVFQSVYLVAMIEAARSHPAEAEAFFKRAVSLQIEALGADHPAMAPTYDRLAGVYSEERKFALAEPLYKHAIAILEKANPAENPDLADTDLHYAALLRRLDRETEAESLETEARSIRQALADKAAQRKSRQVNSGFTTPENPRITPGPSPSPRPGRPVQ